MPLPNYDNPRLEHRALRRISTASALWESGTIAQNLDLSGTSLNNNWKNRIGQAFDAYGDRQKTRALALLAEVAVTNPVIVANE